MATDRICAERISEQLAGRLKQFDEIDCATQSDNEDISDAAYSRIDELPLSIETRRVVEICLSWGGPADYFIVTLDDDGDIEEVRYRFQDWGDVADVTLTGDDFERACLILHHYTDELGA